MRVAGGWRWSGAAIVALGAWLAWASPAGAQEAAEPTASVEVVGAPTPELLAKPLEVNFKPPEGQPGELELPLVAREEGPLSVTFLDLKTGRQVAIRRTPGKATALSVTGRIPQRSLVPGQLYLLQLVFTPPKAEPEALEGVLEVGIAGGAPIARTVVPGSPHYAPAQKKVEISSTRFMPFTSAPDVSRYVGVSSVGSTQAPTDQPLAQNYLAFSSWGNATVTISPPNPGGDPSKSKIAVTGVSGVGTATSTVDLGGEGKPSQEIEIVVQVGDAIWFPLVVILLGVGFGKLLPTWWEARRQRKLLAAALNEAIAKYQKAKGGHGEPKDPSPPEDHLKSLDEELPKFKKLAKRLETRRRLPIKIEAEAKNAKEATDQLEGWVAVHGALRKLAQAVAEASPRLSTAQGDARKPLQDSETLLAEEFAITPDLAASERRAVATALQAKVLEEYAAIFAAVRGPGQAADDDSERALSEAIWTYSSAGPPLARSAKKGELLVETMRQIRGWLPREPRPDRRELAIAADVAPARMITVLPGEILGRVVELVHPKGGKSPEEVMAQVRRGDWAMFFVAAVVSSLAYLLPLYASGPFGTPLQYAGAFVAGAGAQVAIAGVAMPIARSLKSGGGDEKKDGKPAAPAPATT